MPSKSRPSLVASSPRAAVSLVLSGAIRVALFVACIAAGIAAALLALAASPSLLPWPVPVDGASASLGAAAVATFLGVLLAAAVLRAWRRARDARRARLETGRARDGLEAVAAAARDAVVSMTPDGVVRTWNPAAEAMYGCPATEAVGRPFLEFVDPIDGLRTRAVLDDTMASETPIRRDAIHRRRDGVAIEVSAAWSVVRAERPGDAVVWLVARPTGTAAHVPHPAPAEAASSPAADPEPPRTEVSGSRLRHVLDTAPDAIITLDDGGRIIAWNPAATRIFGWSETEALSLQAGDLLGPGLRDRSRPGGSRLAIAAWRRLAGRTVPVTAVRAAGECFPAELWMTTYDLDGRTWYTVFGRDVTERTSAIEALAEHERRYRELVETMPAVVYRASIELDRNATYVSPRIEELLGRSPEEWTGTPGIWRSHIHPEDIEATSAIDQAALDGNGDRSVTEYRMITRSGATIWVRDVATIIRDAGGRPVSWSGYLLEITDRKRLEEQLVQQAFRDPLTGLANRALFGDRVRHAVERQGTANTFVGMLMIDLDEFKAVNDTLGHAAGDQLLVEVGQRLRAGVGIGATVARLGGDEFAVLLEDLPDEAAAIAVATRLIRALEAPVRIGTNHVQVRASIGIAVDLGRRGKAEWLFRSADVAVYEAKRRGRGQWQVYDPATYLAATKRAAVESGLRRAVERSQFDVLYQPIIALDGGRVIGAEALVRWRHPSRGEVPPAEFLAIAEKTGLIIQIGAQVLDRVCAELRTCADAHPSFQAMTVNISGRQLESEALVGQVRDAVAKHGADSSLLILEVTESIALDEDGPTLDRLRALKQLGVRIAIDDFGTGYSSLAYLRRLPVDILKIDRSFIENIADSEDAVAVARTIVDLAKTLRLSVVAEGIEHRAQEAVVRELGCDFAQGFLFAKPLKSSDLRDLLALQDTQGLRAVS